MNAKCPGQIANQALESTLAQCPGCGRTVELFADEERVFCRCGQSVFRQSRPGCFQWCKNAALCRGNAMPPLKPQNNREVALATAFAAFRGRTREQLTALGASQNGQGFWHVQVLDSIFVIDPPRQTVTLWGAGLPYDTPVEPAIEWRILALHYLAADPPPLFTRWIGFADMADARGYEKVYRGRVLGRLRATVGRDRRSFVEACLRRAGERVTGLNEGYQFQVFPRLPVTILWYGGDDELGPDVSMVYPDHVASLLAVEDIVVLSERLVAQLQGAGW